MAALALGGGLYPGMSAAAEDLAVYRCVQPDGRVMYSDTATVKGMRCKLVDAVPSYRLVTRPPLPPAKQEPARRLSVEHAKRLVEHDLRDPEATHYREVFRGASGAVCGQMNAKNGLGGYVGYVDFIVTPDGERVLTREDDGRIAFDSAYLKHCRQTK